MKKSFQKESLKTNRIAFYAAVSTIVILVSFFGTGCDAPEETTKPAADGSFYAERPISTTPSSGPTPIPDTTSHTFVAELKASTGDVQEGVPITFTYSVTNTSKTPQQISHTMGKGFNISVAVQYLAWDMISADTNASVKEAEAINSANKTVDVAQADDAKKNHGFGGGVGKPLILPHIPPLKFNPGETKAFTVTWTPAKGSVHPGSTFWARANLWGDVKGEKPSASLRLTSKPQQPLRFR